MVALIRQAGEQDIEHLKRFASRSGVAFEGIGGPLGSLFIMESDLGQFMAMVAIEDLKETGLLRTLVIDSDLCKMEDVVRFFATVIAEAERRGYDALMLITPSPGVFEPLGFVQAADADLPDPVKEMAAANERAVVMVKKI